MNERADRSGGAAPGAGRTHRVPVLVVGGSLVGLSMSVFLGRLGVRHTLVERHAGTSIHPRGRGNNVRTMEIFRVAGTEPDIRRAAATLADNHGILQTPTLVGDAGEWLFKQIDPGNGLARFSPSSWCLCSQNDLEPELLTHAVNLGGDLRFGTELLSFETDADGVTAIVKSRETGEHTTIRADYLVAADGPRSPVREQLGIGQSGPGDLFHNVSITFRSRRLADVVGDRRFIVCYLTDENADGALLPVDNRENWVFHAPWHPEQGETVEDFTDERCAAHIRRAIGDPDLDVEITGKAPWHAAQRVARSYRSGRVLLAGDSAHEMSPTGAFGSNTGIQDAHNLAWKLAAVLEGWAGEPLLDTYDAERRPVAEATSARAAHRSVEHSHPGFAPPPGMGGGAPGGALGGAPRGGPGGGPGGEGPGGAPRGGPGGVPGGGGPGGMPGGAPGGGGPAGTRVGVPGGGGPAGASGGAPAGPPGGPQRGILNVALGYRYPQGAVVGADPATPVVPEGLDLTGAPGSRAPHLWLRRGEERLSTLDLYEDSLVLLSDAAQPTGWHEAATEVAAALRVPLKPYRVGGTPGADLVPDDEETDWARAHGVTRGGAVLIRPDGFVAWRSPGPAPDPEAMLRQVVGTVLSRA
ncbi:FAD-dependent monooxygenase [Streptomyces sp. SID10362]|uniref:FAD-dependent oxidoreductase n=1 Tax=Streptomyces sp. SID10362 TaxID=2706021 RepID=UPI0013CB9BD1|nr:FAD-dependent monooxygenase [Streptomyces sp. SID10362]NDZ74165.1 FAD-dependent monooxygenase [Streptomyces sp. SID10362]